VPFRMSSFKASIIAAAVAAAASGVRRTPDTFRSLPSSFTHFSHTSPSGPIAEYTRRFCSFTLQPCSLTTRCMATAVGFLGLFGFFRIGCLILIGPRMSLVVRRHFLRDWFPPSVPSRMVHPPCQSVMPLADKAHLIATTHRHLDYGWRCVTVSVPPPPVSLSILIRRLLCPVRRCRRTLRFREPSLRYGSRRHLPLVVVLTSVTHLFLSAHSLHRPG